MRVDPASGVRIVGEPIPYADGGEAQLRSIVESASDRSSASDELAARITDWPSRYHLSRLRANLLRPLAVGRGVRVLDVGAGTGALARYLGETGAEVVALEGSLERARIAAARCEDLPNVKVTSGRLADFDDEEGFDLVVVVGVLEYASSPLAGTPVAPLEFLAQVRNCTRPDGCVALAIENQLGLKYLLGYPEDHLGEPWIGVEGYAGSQVRTFSRRALGTLVHDAGFPRQEWLFPFPDYKLPTKILAAAAYREPDAATFVDQLLRHPVRGAHGGRALFCDDRAAHRVFLDAGLATEVANSFLLLAATGEGGLRRFLPEGTLAWLFGDDRLQMWLRAREVRATPEGRVVCEGTASAGPRRERGWLRQAVPSDVAYTTGRTVEQIALEACRRGDLDQLEEVLRRWRQHVAEAEVEPEPVAQRSNPFLRASTRRVLPPRYLDVNLDNFVVTPEGSVHFVDAEWEAVGGMDAQIAVARSLWWFAHNLVTSGAAHPWSASSTVDELAQALGRLCGETVGQDTLAGLLEAEADLQAKVSGTPVAQAREELERLGGLSRSAMPASGRLPYTRLRRQAAELEQELGMARGELARVGQELAASQDRVAALTGEIGGLAGQLADLEARLAESAGAAAAERERAGRVEEQLAAVAAERESVAVELARRQERLSAAEGELANLRGRRSVRWALRAARLGAPWFRLRRQG